MEGALNIMCLLLSKVVHLENQPSSLRNRLQEKAIILEERLLRDGPDAATAHLATSFSKLKGLLKFFDLYRAKQYSEAFQVSVSVSVFLRLSNDFVFIFQELIALEILPLQLKELDARVRDIKNYNEDFRTVLPNVLLAAMTILLAQHDTIKKNNNIFSTHMVRNFFI